MFFLNKRSNFEKKPQELSYRSNNSLHFSLFSEKQLNKGVDVRIISTHGVTGQEGVDQKNGL